MNAIFYDETGRVVGHQKGNLIYTPRQNGPALRVESVCLNDYDSGEHLGYLHDGVVYNYYQKPQAWTSSDDVI